jgi:sulfate permease, SulP family
MVQAMKTAILLLPAQCTAYLRRSLRFDLAAGLTVAMVVLPQAMAYAAIAGINPIYGIYAAILPAIIGALFGSSPFLVSGPTNATALVTLSVLLSAVGPAYRLELVFVLAILSGVIKLLLGVFRLGWITRYVSNSVLTGFMAAAGLLIIVGQLGSLLGLSIPKDQGMLVSLAAVFQKLAQVNLWVALTAGLGLAVMVAVQRFNPRFPGALIAVLLTGLVVNFGGLDHLGVAQVVQLGLPANPNPALLLPYASLAELQSLLPAAGALALFSLVEALSVTRALSLASGRAVDPSREFIGQGLASIAGGLSQCLPPSGSPTRSAVNYHAGARTRLAPAFSGVLVWVLLLLFAKLIGYIPLPALAAVVVVSAAGLVDFKQIRLTWKTRAASRLVMVVTFCATLFLQLHIAIYLGVLLSIAIYLYESGHLRISYLVIDPAGRVSEKPVKELVGACPAVAVVNLEGDLYFGAAEDLDALVEDCIKARVKVLVLRMRRIRLLASTGATTLKWAFVKAQKQGMVVLLSGVDPATLAILNMAEITPLLSPEHIFHGEETLFESTLLAYQYAQKLLN